MSCAQARPVADQQNRTESSGRSTDGVRAQDASVAVHDPSIDEMTATLLATETPADRELPPDAGQTQDDYSWVRPQPCEERATPEELVGSARKAFEEMERLKKKFALGKASEREKEMLRAVCHYFKEHCCRYVH